MKDGNETLTHYFRNRAKRLREIATDHRTEMSRQLEEMADEMEAWAARLERKP